ncbi:NAD-dependent epimerase/dehydratase family protein [Geodermatophilus sp. SYSU D00814]
MARVLLAGGTGAVGRPVLPLLLAAGHQVTATTRSPERAGALRAAVTAARPDVVVHQLTALATPARDYGSWLVDTNRLRAEGRYPFVHVDDAAAVTVTAVERGGPGVYDVVDDDPAPMREWVPHLARLLGGPEPSVVPADVAEREIGPQAVYYGTQLRGASNARARRELGMQPRHPSWREGFRAVFGAA